MAQLKELRKEARRQERLIERLGADPFIGTTQAAKIFGIAKTNIGRLRDAGAMPEPVQELPSGPVYLRAAVEVAARERAAG